MVMLPSRHFPLTWQFLNSVVSELFYYLTLDSFVVHYTRFFLFLYHFFFNSLQVCTRLLYSIFLAVPANAVVPLQCQ